MKRFYEIKNVFSSDFEGSMIKDVDMKSRTVTGYFSRFGNVDHDGDMLMPGAFTKTLKERGFEGKNLIPHLLDHEMETLKQLSKPKIYEKSDGGFFESTISDTNNGIDTLKLYRDGVINQHSFGFRVLRKENKKDYRAITETLLYEISTVVLGANDQTPFTGFKSLTSEQILTVRPKIIERYNLLKKCHENGDYTDEIFPILEAQMKQLEQEMIELFLKEQSMKLVNDMMNQEDEMTMGENMMCPECGTMMNQTDQGMVCPNCGNTIKKHDTQATAPTVTTVTQPEVDVLTAERLNNIYKRLKVTDTYGKLRKIGESC